MKLAYWMYSGPAHIGTLRVASSWKNVHAIMHCPLGDDYYNVMRSMLEREYNFTPVTSSIVDRHVLTKGSRDRVVDNICRKDNEEKPSLILLTPTCTSSLLQEDLKNFVERASFNVACDVLLADVNHYRINELQAADRTLEQVVKFYLEKTVKANSISKTALPSVNLIGFFTLGFHNEYDCRELIRIFKDINVTVHQILPEGGNINELKSLPKAWVNIIPYREVGLLTAKYLQTSFNMPYISLTPMGILGMAEFLKALSDITKIDYGNYIETQTKFISQSTWFSRSIDCQNLTGKKAVVFGDTTHSAAITRILTCEMGFRVVLAGTYCRHDADWFREEVSDYCQEILVTENHTLISNAIARIEPAVIFGTQIERHIGKRLDIPCGVISAPVHIQNFPLGFRPFFGYEGSNQIADLIYNTLTLGMEDHLLEIFGGHDTKQVITKLLATDSQCNWTESGLLELQKIPGFVRNKVKRNTEKFARDNSISKITLEVLFAAKESLSQS